MNFELTHDEYSFGLNSSRIGEATTTLINPFTKEEIIAPTYESLTLDEVNAILEIFDRNNIDDSNIDEDGYSYSWNSNDTIRFVHLFLKSPVSQTGGVKGFTCELVVKSKIPDEILSLIYDMSKAGNLILMDYVGKNARIIEGPITQEMKEQWHDIKIIESISELANWLSNSIGSRRVIGSSSSPA